MIYILELVVNLPKYLIVHPFISRGTQIFSVEFYQTARARAPVGSPLCPTARTTHGRECARAPACSHAARSPPRPLPAHRCWPPLRSGLHHHRLPLLRVPARVAPQPKPARLSPVCPLLCSPIRCSVYFVFEAKTAMLAQEITIVWACAGLSLVIPYSLLSLSCSMLGHICNLA